MGKALYSTTVLYLYKKKRIPPIGSIRFLLRFTNE